MAASAQLTVKIADGLSVSQMTVREAAEGEVPRYTVNIADGSHVAQMTVRVASAGEAAQCCVVGLPSSGGTDQLDFSDADNSQYVPIVF